MKKFIFLTLATASFLMISCKKDYNCDCIVLGNELSGEIPNHTKSKAEEVCADVETTYKIGDPSASCTLNPQ